MILMMFPLTGALLCPQLL